MPDPVPDNYTPTEKRTRIRVYIAIAIVATLSTNIVNLAAMTDQQLAAISPLRWTFTVLLALLAAGGAGLNTFRAAIDRSTAGGNGAATTADNNPQTPSSIVP